MTLNYIEIFDFQTEDIIEKSKESEIAIDIEN